MTVPSWMLVSAPTRMRLVSPRSTQPNQMLARGPISTSPMMTAPGAMKASGAMRGWRPSKGMINGCMRLASGEHRLLLEPGGLGPAGHQVHVLHRLARGALHQIVDDRDQDRTALHPVGEDADQAVVRAPDMARRRRLAGRQHPHEGLVGIALGQ